ncbi:MAG: hypothetical protein WCB48_03885, partial [Casimicrobiaceae bacterium]
AAPTPAGAPPRDGWAVPAPEPREERLDTLAALVHAQDELIALARHHIRVFDIDLSWGGWNTAARCSALSQFLRRDRAARLSVIVHDTHWLEASGSRFTALLQRHAPAMTLYRTGPVARAAMDPLLIVDDQHFLHRQHIAWPRATLSIGNRERAMPLCNRFDEIWETGEPGLSGSVLGL